MRLGVEVRGMGLVRQRAYMTNAAAAAAGWAGGGGERERGHHRAQVGVNVYSRKSVIIPEVGGEDARIRRADGRIRRADGRI